MIVEDSQNTEVGDLPEQKKPLNKSLKKFENQVEEANHQTYNFRLD